MDMHQEMDLQLFADAGTLVNAGGNYVNAYTGETTAFPEGGGMTASMKTFYDTELLENARPELIHTQFARKQVLPAGRGKTVEWRKWNTLEDAGALTEGVIPTGQKFGVTTVTGTVDQYGTYTAITDKLDAVGNTTAAIGKGFAIGSAAFATVSLIVAYVGNYTAINAEPVLNMASYIVVAGGIIGGALIEYFSALLTDNTIESARLMADEGDRQLSRPGVLEGTVRPDYNRCIEMAARQALKKMLLPSVLALLIPIVGGFVFGVEFVGGLLIGATIVAIPRAIFMGNSGGAFDNAKKYIESGSLEGHGKGSDAHKASVVGDTVGDTRKDVVGVALDIFIKTMSTVANTLATVFQHITLIR